VRIGRHDVTFMSDVRTQRRDFSRSFSRFGMRTEWQFIAVMYLTFVSQLFSAQVKLLRHPSYNHGRVAFSYSGDIWTANEDGTSGERLTVHKARNVFPRFSPDGRWIAFSSNRNGNYDVFVIPSRGGQVRQLTFHSGDDTVVGWTPDSRRVVFQAARSRLFPGVPNLYEVSVDGGLEEPIQTDWGYWGSYSPDSRKLAFNRHPMVWWRQHYRGGYAADLWVMDVASRKFTRLSDDSYKGNWYWPMYGAHGEIYFVADRLADEKRVKPGSPEVMKSVKNIWKIAETGGQAVQVTHHTSGQLFYPSISSDGRVIVYEENFGLWKLDTVIGKSTEIRINIASDEKENAVQSVAVQSESDSFSLSPSTNRAAISTHGKIFTIPTHGGAVQRVTEGPFRNLVPEWSPDGKGIAFVSDRSGREEIWIADEFGAGLKVLSNSDSEKSTVEWSPDAGSMHFIEWAPDSKSLLYSASDHGLYRVNLGSGKTEVVTSSEIWNVMNPRFSPDGKWISYTKLDHNLRPHVYVRATSGGEEHHIGRDDLFSETGARWTPDGKTLIFLAGISQGGANPGERRPTELQLYSIVLSKGGPDRPAKGVEVKIEWDGIQRRIRQLTHLAGNLVTAVPSPDGNMHALVTEDRSVRPTISTLYTVSNAADRVTPIATSEPSAGVDWQITSPYFSKDGRTLYFLAGNGIHVADIGSAEASSSRHEPHRMVFQARLEVDHHLERRQIFAECWRVLQHYFYDTNMHGADWAKIRTVYEAMVEQVADQGDMDDLLNRMLGELNASHIGLTRSVRSSNGQGSTRYPGFELEADPTGRYRVSQVYKDGPADRDSVRIRRGAYILSVNDHELKAGENYWKFYNAASGEKMKFLVNSSPSLEGAWQETIEPVSAAEYETLIYNKWVVDRAAMVGKFSGGQIGYVHIRSMNLDSFTKFERELVDNHFKKALIIDVRFNPGGALDQVLLPLLQQRQYQYTRWRGSIQAGRPQRAFYGPIAILQNEMTFSNGEIFADGFRTLGLGKIIGTQTYGGVISTGAHRLIDGSTLRVPNAGVWNVKGYDLENYGVPPDIYVDNTPEDFLKGRDAQLEKAVEVLKRQIIEK
jgi:tricorn protease